MDAFNNTVNLKLKISTENSFSISEFWIWVLLLFIIKSLDLFIVKRAIKIYVRARSISFQKTLSKFQI